MNAGLVSVLFVASALVAVGAFTVVWRRELTAALGGLPLMFGGAGIAFSGIARYAAAAGAPILGQGVAVLLAIVALGAVTLGVGLAGRETSR